MVNSIILKKETRMGALKKFVSSLQKNDKEIERKKLINWMIVTYNVSKRLAVDEIDAVLDWAEIENAEIENENDKENKPKKIEKEIGTTEEEPGISNLF